ncbi:MAG: MMPL family transporter, partial [Pirellulales bacterium]
MSKGFYSSKTFLGLPNALILLMLIFFSVPFALRGARMALQKTENNVKDWLPADFRETEELAWFAKHFVSEQFVVATWNGCNEDSQRLKMFVAKLQQEVSKPAVDSENKTDIELAQETLGDYVLFVDKEEYNNWGGLQEKWLVDENGKNYYITPNGRLYRWDGGANVVSAVGRAITRATGSFSLDGSFVAAFGKPSTEDEANAFWANPRLLTTPLFKSIETGPQVVQQIAGPGKGLYVESNPIAGQRMAVARLTGTLFGPPVPADFGWRSEDMQKLLPEASLSQLPAGWETEWTRIVQKAVDEKFGGDLAKLRKADPVDQAEVWYEFFDLAGIPEPARQTSVILTLTEQARRNLGRVIGRGVLGQPTGRVFEIAEECGVSAPPKPIMAPPPFSWFVQKPKVVEPAIRLGGPPVDNVAIDEEGTITLVRLIGYSLALGLFLSYILLRSFRLTFMVFFVGGVSAMASMSLVWWGGASVDAILLTMPSLVYVLGMSGAVHIVNYYRDAATEKGIENAPERAISHAFLPCLLANVTTAIGLVSLCNSNILPIRKFGIFSAMGVMFTLVLLYLYLPSALTIFPPGKAFFSGASKKLSKRISGVWESIGSFIIRRHWFVNAALFGSMILMTFGVLKIETSVQLLKMFDKESQIISDYAWLESNFGRLVPMELVVRFPEDVQAPAGDSVSLTDDQQRKARTKLTLLERAEAVRKVQDVLQDQFGYGGQNIIGRGMSGITFIRDLPQPTTTYSPSRSGANNLMLSKRSELLQSDYVALEKSPIAKDSELWRISLRLGALNNVDYGQFVNSLRGVVEPVVAAYRCRSEVMNAVIAKDSAQIKGLILVLGQSEPALTGASKQSYDDPQKRDLAMFSETLRNSLINNSIHKIQWHNPDQMPLKEGRATSEEWGKYLGKFDCVVMLNKHSDYDLDFVKQNAKSVVDASVMLEDSRIASLPTQPSVSKTPIELG